MDAVSAAFLSGPIYDPLYSHENVVAAADRLGLRVDFRGDHPELNHHLSSLAEVPYDLISTHTKYAPSQAHFLAPLDDLLSKDELADFAPSILEMARVDGTLRGLPRNVDVRLLHYRRDLIPQPPVTWNELFTLASKLVQPPELFGFVFPGRESGLFGTFYELAEMGGAHLFPPSGIPQLDNQGGQWALKLLRSFVAEGISPAETPELHYDQAHRYFLEGRAAMVGDWPGYFASYCDASISRVADRFAVCPYPTGPTGRSLAYGGSHTFALTHRGAANPAAVEMLRILTSVQSQLFEAKRGSVPVRHSVMKQMQASAQLRERARWKALQDVIESHMLIPPKLACYPNIEEVIWKTVQAAIVGTVPISESLQLITQKMQQIMEAQHVR
jgi:multiple sugar transport system substrate-binding protein